MIKDGAELTTIQLDEGELFLKIYLPLMACSVWEVQWIPGWKMNILG